MAGLQLCLSLIRRSSRYRSSLVVRSKEGKYPVTTRGRGPCKVIKHHFPRESGVQSANQAHYNAPIRLNTSRGSYTKKIEFILNFSPNSIKHEVTLVSCEHWLTTADSVLTATSPLAEH